jgi:RNA polymerase sigma factor for flagellar operon FliA
MHGRVKSAVEIEDLIQIGMYGLVTAAQNYVVKEGVSFASYAGIRIRGEIVDHLRRNSNLCRTTIQMQQKYNTTFEKLSRQLQREPKNSEIAKDMGLETSELDNWEQAFAANTHQSLDSVYDEFSIWFASNDQSPEDELSDTELRENLVEALKTLPEREAMLIQLYYVEELNVYEIAEVLEITTGRVSQIKKSAISRLREFIQKID